MFTLTFETDNSPFTEGYKAMETRRALESVLEQLPDTLDDDESADGIVRDMDGNTIGKWSIT